MSANLSWQEFWAIFNTLEDDRKVATFSQNFKGLNGWKEFIASQTPKNQCEVLDGAPKPLIRTLKPVLSPQAQLKLLGIEKRNNGRRIR